MSPSYVCRDLFSKLKESFLVSPFLKDFLPKPPGLHTTAREPQIPREDPQEREERKKIVARRGKKSAKFFGFPAEGGPVEGGPVGAVRRRRGGRGKGVLPGEERSFLGRAVLPGEGSPGEGCCGG